MSRSDSLSSFAPGVWLDFAPVSILGMKLTATMTVLEIGDGELLLHSPIGCTAERRAAVEALGSVAHLYSPNTFHHLWIGEWAEAFPSATLHAPAGLASKRKDLTIDRTHGAGEPAFADAIEEHRIEGFRLEESVLLHRRSGTLVVADLVHNVGRPAGGWTAVYTKMMGFYDRVALSRAIRWTGFSDRRAARRSLDAVLERPWQRLVVGHGEPIDDGAREALRGAFEWLPAAG